MLHCYTKKCFTGITALMLLAKVSLGAVRDTTVNVRNNDPDFVTGTVIDQDARPLKNATVTIKGTNTTVVTDDNGHFDVKAAGGSTLVFKCKNQYTNEVVVSADKNITVRLLDRFVQNPDKVDVLYGQQNKSSVLASISTIYTNQLTTTPASLYVYALPGQLAGLYTQQTSGFTTFGNTALFINGFGQNFVQATSQNNRSNDNQEIGLSLRGQSSLPGLNNGPVTIIDGVQREISSIDPESIESVSVLKDALSTILLGINSSRGVLLVTTKRAEAGTPRITFTAETGYQNSIGMPTPLPAYQYAYLYNEALTNDGKSPIYTATDFEKYKDHSDPQGHPDVNWFNTILRKNSPITQYKLNVNGGTETAKYTVSLSYLDQQGLFNEASSSPYNTNNELSRYIINSNVAIQVNKKLNVDLQLFGRIQQATQPGGDISNGGGYQSILNALYRTPNNAYPIYNTDGSFGGSAVGGTTGPYANNLLAMTEYSGYFQNNTDDILANLDLKYDLNSVTKGLSFNAKGNLSYQTQNTLNRTLQVPTYVPKTDTSYVANGKTTAQVNAFNTIFTQRQSFAQVSLDYDRQFGKSNLTAKLMYDTKTVISNYDLAAVTADRALQVAYNYDNKYFLEGAGNISSYNRYTPGHQSGLFYAGGAGWQMGNEDFIKENVSWIDSWKWRVTYGRTGNNNVDVYSYYGYKQTYSSGNYLTGLYYVGTDRSNPVFGYYPNTIADPLLSWERADKLNIGADISLFKEHLQLTAEYYHDKYYDLLGVRGANTVLLGTPYPYENIGTNVYHGEEFTATYQDHAGSFNYFITGNFSIQASKVITNDEAKLYPNSFHEGLPVTAIFGYKADGFYQNAAEAAQGPTLSGTAPQAGDIRYVDLGSQNGKDVKDGVINQFDQTAIGGLKPLMFYGTTLGFNYKGLSFSVLFEGVLNRDINVLTNPTFVNPNPQQATSTSIPNYVAFPFPGLGNPYGQAYANAVNRWTPETANTATLPRLSFTGTNYVLSSYWIRNGDYLRIKNAEIGYTLPYQWSRKLRLSSIRVFVNGENLATIAGFKGFDPEVAPDNYPMQRVINTGISVKL